MAGAKTYDLKSIQMIVGGVSVDGAQDGDKAVMAFAEDAFTMTNGADGETQFAKSNNASGTITFTLLYSSGINQIFSDLYEADRTNNGGLTSITLRDTRGATLITARACRIQKFPDVTLAREGGTMEWIFMCAELRANAGGLADEQPTV